MCHTHSEKTHIQVPSQVLQSVRLQTFYKPHSFGVRQAINPPHLITWSLGLSRGNSTLAWSSKYSMHLCRGYAKHGKKIDSSTLVCQARTCWGEGGMPPLRNLRPLRLQAPYNKHWSGGHWVCWTCSAASAFYAHCVSVWVLRPV